MLRVFRGKSASVLVVVVLVMSLAAPAAWAGPKGKPAKVKLKDIKGHWAEQEIERMGAWGLIQGYEDFSFRPRNEVTHQEAFAMLLRAMGLEEEARARAGLQVGIKHREQLAPWAAGYLAEALDKGLVLPGELATIIPNRPAKRGEVAAYLARVLIWAKLSTLEGIDELDFEDADEITGELMAYVSPVYTWGLMLGDDQHKFQPNKPVTRAEMAVILSRLTALLENTFEEDEQRVAGTLQGITLGESPRIRIEKQSGAEVTIPVADGASVYRNNRRADLEDLKVGDQVEVIINDDGEATFIAATAPNVIVTVEGTLEDIDLGDRTVSLTLENMSEAVYEVAAGAQVTLNARTVPLSALRAGDAVKLSLRDGQVVKIEARRDEARVEGVITSLVLGSNPKITVKKDNGAGVTYPVDRDAGVELDGEEADLNDLETGYRVELKLQHGKVYEISAYSANQVEGTVVSVTIGSNPKIVLRKEDNREATYAVAANAQVKLDGRTAGLVDILPGYRVDLTLRDGKVSKLAVTSREVEVQGTVKSVTIGSPASLKLKRSDGIESTFVVADRAEIKVDGEPAALAALAGLEVELRLQEHRVVKIEADTETEVEGRVVSVTLGSPAKITVEKEDGRQSTYTIAADANIELDGEEAELGDLASGFRVELKLRGGKVTEIEAESSEEERELAGTVINVIIGAPNKLVVDVEDDERTTFTVASDAVIKVDGRTRPFSALEPGYEVELTLQGDVVARVEAETGN